MKWPTKRSALAIALALSCHLAGAGAVWRVGQRETSPRRAIPVSAVTSPTAEAAAAAAEATTGTHGSQRNRLAKAVETAATRTQFPITAQMDFAPIQPATSAHTASAPPTPASATGMGAAQTEATAQTETPGPTSTELAEVRARIEEHVRYPLSLRRLGVQGVAQVSVQTSKNGGIEDIRISQTSGSAGLDELAIAAVREAAPLPTSRALTFLLPIEFRTSDSQGR